MSGYRQNTNTINNSGINLLLRVEFPIEQNRAEATGNILTICSISDNKIHSLVYRIERRAYFSVFVLLSDSCYAVGDIWAAMANVIKS